MWILPSCNTKVFAVASSGRPEPGRPRRASDSSLTLACDALMIDAASRRPQSHRRWKGVTLLLSGAARFSLRSEIMARLEEKYAKSPKNNDHPPCRKALCR